MSELRRAVFLVGMPRSGTSWLSQIVESSPEVRYRLSPIFSWDFKNSVDEDSSRDDWLRLMRGAWASESAFMRQDTNRQIGAYPRFEGAHGTASVLAMKMTRFHNLLEPHLRLFPETRMAAVVRDPRGAIHSWLTTPGEFPAGADPMAQWRSGACRKGGFGEFWGFDDWKAVTLLHLRLEQEHPGRFRVWRYEDFVRDPVRRSQELFYHYGLVHCERTRAFVSSSQESHHDSPYAVFKDPKVKDRWRTQLQPEIQAAILAELQGTPLARFLD